MNDWDDAITSLTTGPQVGPVIFKRATTGAIQQWQVETDKEKYRTIHGQFAGTLIYSEWTVCEGKNIGKKNETSPEEQAKLEVAALYKKKLAQGKYYEYLTDIDNEGAFVSPMLAQPFTEKKLGEKFSIQPKLDGVRCIATKKGLYSRQGKPFPAMKHIHESLAPVFEANPDLILDGELYNHKYKADFQELISVIKQQKPTEEDFEKAKEVVHYHIYDMVSPIGFSQREEYLFEALADHATGDEAKDGRYGYPTGHKYIYVVDLWQEQQSIQDIKDKFEAIIKEGYEGLIVRNEGIGYEHKRTYQLMKYKEFTDEEFEVADIEEGEGNWSGHAKIATLWLPGADKSKGIIRKGPERTVFGAGVKGSKSYAKRLLAAKNDVIGKLATVTFFRLTDDGIPYLPIFKVIRDYE